MDLSEEIRHALYPLGILSTIAFTLRFVFQWLQSEQVGHSVVHRSFWVLSIAGNLSLGVHSFIQGQFPVCLVQSLNLMISIRNLNLLQPPLNQWAFKTVLISILGAFIIPFLLFYLFSNEAWMRVPLKPLDELSNLWHLLGIVGVTLFASRFWVQWIQAEIDHKSELTQSFWWISLIGAFFSIAYFFKIQDYVNLVGPLFGLIPYFRNLVLLKRAS